ncbi:MAG: hypothetical protein ACREJ5_17130 [Geminicoccaceae bacterium]
MMLMITTGAVERPKIEIDGEVYELVAPTELSITDHQRLASRGRRIEALMARDRLETSEQVELGVAVTEASDVLLRHVPADVRGRLADAHRLQVLDSFSALMLRTRLRTVAGETARA